MSNDALYNQKKDALARLISEVTHLSIGWDDNAVLHTVQGVLFEARSALASGDEQAIDVVGRKLRDWKESLESERSRA